MNYIEMDYYTDEDKSFVNSLKEEFVEYKKTDDYLEVFEKESPLVSTITCTYNRPKLLMDRCIDSILKQTYKNIQIVIVGDRCHPDTNKEILDRIEKIGDDRIIFESFGEFCVRSVERGSDEWKTAGSEAYLRALEIANGDFITQLDDDDWYVENRIEILVKEMKEKKLDLVYHAWSQHGKIFDYGGKIEGGKTGSCVNMFHKFLKKVGCDPLCAQKYNEPSDINRFMKYIWVGSKYGYVNMPLTHLGLNNV